MGDAVEKIKQFVKKYGGRVDDKGDIVVFDVLAEIVSETFTIGGCIPLVHLKAWIDLYKNRYETDDNTYIRLTKHIEHKYKWEKVPEYDHAYEEEAHLLTGYFVSEVFLHCKYHVLIVVHTINVLHAYHNQHPILYDEVICDIIKEWDSRMGC